MSTPEGTQGLAARIAERVRAEELEAAARAPGRLADRVSEALAVVLLGVIVLLVFLNALFRYLFSNPLVWTEEIVATLIIWLAVAGAFLALRRGQLITIEVVTARLPPGPRAALEVAIQLASAGVLAYLAWLGLRYTGLFGGDTTPFFGFPKGFFMAAIPLGMGAMALACLLGRWSRRERR